jgi:hypothetical protein
VVISNNTCSCSANCFFCISSPPNRTTCVNLSRLRGLFEASNGSVAKNHGWNKHHVLWFSPNALFTRNCRSSFPASFFGRSKPYVSRQSPPLPLSSLRISHPQGRGQKRTSTRKDSQSLGARQEKIRRKLAEAPFRPPLVIRCSSGGSDRLVRTVPAGFVGRMPPVTR